VSLLEDWSIVVPNAVIDTCNKESTIQYNTISWRIVEHIILIESVWKLIEGKEQHFITGKYLAHRFFDKLVLRNGRFVSW
jgi:hypothetical protein